MTAQADIDIIADHYQEDWWLEALLNMDAFHGVWHRQVGALCMS